jgi:hypothetical protein
MATFGTKYMLVWRLTILYGGSMVTMDKRNVLELNNWNVLSGPTMY